MDLDYHSWLPLSGHSNWYLLGLSMNTLTITHCLQLKVKDAFIVVFPPENTWLTSLVPPQCLRHRAIWSREQGHITQAHRHEITASVCLSYPHKVCVFLFVCAHLLPTEIGLAIIAVPIWWKHYSFDVILYHINLWQAIREGDELFFHLRGREEEGGTLVVSLPAVCCTSLSRLQHAASV